MDAKPNRTRRMRRFLIGAGLAVLGAALIVVSSCGKKEAPVDESMVVRPVKTMILDAGGAGSVRSFPGKVKASQAVDLAFEVAGKIAELPVNEGQAVKQGDTLARLDPRDFENRLAKQKSVYENAKANLDRAKRLLASGAISEVESDRKRTAFETTEAEMKIAEKALQDSCLKAPFAGLVAKKFVENYQNVQAKQNILSLQDVSQIEIVVNVPEDLIARARTDEPRKLTAKFESLPGRKFDVTVKEWGTEANKQTQTFPVTVTMAAPEDLNILPGMTAAVTAHLGSGPGGKAAQFNIPVTAVFADEDGKSYVWVVDKASMTAGKIQVKPGGLTGESIKVSSIGTKGNKELKLGDMIITAGVDFVREKMKVRPLKTKAGGGK